jgi:hypothetical protein
MPLSCPLDSVNVEMRVALPKELINTGLFISYKISQT